MAFTFTNSKGDIRQFGVWAPWQWVELFLNNPGLNNQLPLVVCLHGSGVVGEMPNAASARSVMDFEGLVLEANPTDPANLFFVLYLQGLGLEGLDSNGDTRGSWNSGHMDNWSLIQAANDVGFIEEAVDRFTDWMKVIFLEVAGIKANVVDPTRRFLVGFGNGGCMAYRSARQSDYWKAFAVVNGTIGGVAQENAPGSLVRWTPTSQTTQKALLHIHDTQNEEFRPGTLTSPPTTTLPSQDDRQRVLGQQASAVISDRTRRRDLPVVSALTDWVTHNGGSFAPVPGVSNYGGTLYGWSGPELVQYLEYTGPGHSWPTTLTIDAANLIWGFFRDGRI